MSVYGKHNSSFIWFSYKKDKNENDPCVSIEMVSTIGYGHLDFILTVMLAWKMPPPAPQQDEPNIVEVNEEPMTHVLAHITKAKGVEGDAMTELITYWDFG